MRTPSILRVLLTVSVVVGLTVWPPVAAPAGIDTVERYLDSIRDEPDRLAAFLRDMPKGGDLHTHLSGATSTETLLRFAVEDGLCLDTATHVAMAPPCGPRQRPAAETANDPAYHDEVVAAWSMKGFVPGTESGHDHFFATFGKFSQATDGHAGEMLAEVAARAVSQHEYYLEPLLTLGFQEVSRLAERVGFDPDFHKMRAGMTDGGAMERIVASVSSEVDAIFAQFRSVLRCGSRQAEPACTLPIRFDHQVLRANPPEVVFAQMLLGFELMERHSRYVGVNLVQPEDDPVARRDYRLHMRMLGFLRDLYGQDHVTLHAGELTAEVAPPEDLRFHIRDAVLTGQAERIGHGVDIAGEDGVDDLLRTMAHRHVLVEIAFTSNDQILGVSGDDHPFTLYRRSGVPVTLVTDDEGVSRSDLTAQYQQAATAYELSYRELKTMARAAIQHGFLRGADLWRAPDDFRPVSACAADRLGQARPRTSCRALLRSSPKAAAEWRQEGGFDRFERRYGG
ncbi:MAG: adenosine deaminase [Actinomycetota bacterium]|nr:adenosine deaminase [Actinomycetota bacterium]